MISLIKPNGDEEEISRVDVQLSHYRYRVHTQLPPISVLQEGIYRIKVALEGGVEGEHGYVRYEYPIPVEITDLPIVIELTDEELENLQRPISGEGGFQSLLRRIQNQIVGKVLVLSEADGERLIRYEKRYGSGGFQGRLGRIVQKVQEYFLMMRACR